MHPGNRSGPSGDPRQPEEEEIRSIYLIRGREGGASRVRLMRQDDPVSNGQDPPETGAGNDSGRWLTPTLVMVTLVSFMQDAASELLYPLLPVFLTGVLAAPPVVLGVIEGVADAVTGAVRYVAGRLSDRFGRKRFIGAGYGMAAAGKILVASAVSWPMVFVGRVSDRFGKGLRSAPRDALISETTTEGSLGRAFGFHRMGDTAGAVIGPLLGLLALSMLDGDVRAAMWWAVVPGVLAALLTVFIPEKRREPAVAVDEPDPVSDNPLPKKFRRVVIVLAAIALSNFSDALLLLRVLDLGFSTTELVGAYVLFNVVYTSASFPAGVLSDRFPKHRVYAFGLFAFAVGYLGLGLIDKGVGVYALIAVYGLFPAFTDGVGKAWITTLVEPGQLGRAHGVYQAVNNGSVLIAGIWAGLLWTVGPGDGRLPLLLAGSIAAVASIVVAAGFVTDEQPDHAGPLGT